jgi:hypothetical protein
MFLYGPHERWIHLLLDRVRYIPMDLLSSHTDCIKLFGDTVVDQVLDLLEAALFFLKQSFYLWGGNANSILQLL